MANVDAAFGLMPTRHLSGNGYSRANCYTITSGLAENIFTGDVVIVTADGVITPHLVDLAPKAGIKTIVAKGKAVLPREPIGLSLFTRDDLA